MRDVDTIGRAVAVSLHTALGPMRELVTRCAALEAHVGTLRERLAALEARPPVPGPPGQAGSDGAPGRDGIDGPPGKDGTAGLRYAGGYVAGVVYEPGDLVKFGGSAWHCNLATKARPGDGDPAWSLFVQRGRDGKDYAPKGEA